MDKSMLAAVPSTKVRVKNRLGIIVTAYYGLRDCFQNTSTHVLTQRRRRCVDSAPAGRTRKTNGANTRPLNPARLAFAPFVFRGAGRSAAAGINAPPQSC